MIKLSVFIAILLSLGFCASADMLPDCVFLPSTSTAVTDDALATTFNPAGLGIKTGVNAYYLHTFGNEPGGDNAFYISASGIGFGAEYSNPGYARFSKYTISSGGKVVDGLFIGSDYVWYESDNENYDRLSSWDVGIIYRPVDIFSAGFVTSNIRRPKFYDKRTDYSYSLSLAFRPFTNRVTFSVDSALVQGQKIKDAGLVYALEIEPLDGILLRGNYNRDGDFGFSLAIGFNHVRMGAYNQLDDEGEYKTSVFYTQYSGEKYRSMLQREKYLLELEGNNLGLLRYAKDDKSIQGAIINLGSEGYSFARTQELRDYILDFKAEGKKIICYMDLAGDKEYYLASACDITLMNKAGYLSLNGFSSELTYYKGLLDKLGINADLYRIGKYKSASEMFTHEGISESHRESLNSMLDDLTEQLVNGIGENKDILNNRVTDMIDLGPYTAKEAHKAGLVDDLVYVDQISKVKDRAFGEKIGKLSGKSYKYVKDYNYDWTPKPKIAVVYASGIMAPGESMFVEDFGSLLSIPSIMGADTISRALKKAREDESVKAIVLRIDSGGGSVFASDLIWREVVLSKEKKPLVVSMGGAAASGGYYIACPADYIVAEPATITGSIGVIAGKFSFHELYDKLGIEKEIVKRGENADIFNLYKDFSDEQREIVKRHVREMYDDFVSKVAQGRDMDVQDVEEIAQGRVWTGQQAKERNLVDELGGLHLAITVAKTRAGLGDDDEVNYDIYPKRLSFWRRLIVDNVSLLYGKTGFDYLSSLAESLEGLADENMFFILPYGLDLE
ncbi:signal peptide peptidase SppA [Candidatus Poribacteria bacterium]|nr:signal peptide peptidase SppA [Candidatus Poribacteria bacterium]